MIKAKKEISHKKLDNDKRSKSARTTHKIGRTYQGMKLIDKIVYPINICPKCGSKATFHRRMQENNDFIPNVWDSRVEEYNDSFYTVKFDYCLDCHNSFIMEMYIFKKVKKRERKKKKSFWSKLFRI